MHAPLVSIIIPVYNLGPYLENSIRLLIEQTYKNIEIILVDDGSSDHSLEILKASEEKYPNVRVFQQTNAGQGPARNRGLDHATGEFVMFVDGDDWMHPATIERTVNTAIEQNADIVCFGFQMVKKHGEEVEILYQFEHQPEDFKNADYISCFLAENTTRKDILITATWGKLYRRSLLESNSLRFRQRLYEDSLFMLEALLCTEKVAVVSGFLYNYFQRGSEGQLSSMNDGFKEWKVLLFYNGDELMKECLVKKGLWDKYSEDFMRYHNARVVIYGGYFDLYKNRTVRAKNAYKPFIKLLQKHSKGLGRQTATLHDTYGRRVRILHIGLFISRISPFLADRYFDIYEKKYAPERSSN